jgi:twinkle protein
MALHERHRKWIEARGISAELAEKFGLDTVTKDGAAWLAVPYVERGKVVNHKYRMISEKRHQMDKGGRLVLWNHDCLLDKTDKPVVICEGEWDALVAISLGWRAVSVPNGASGAGKGTGAYEYLWDAQDALNAVKHFILATDDDEAGIALRTDLVAYLGADRCSFVDYGADCKDLNEALVLYGIEWVSEVLNSAKPIPVKGLYGIDDFPERGSLTEYPIGIEPLADYLRIVPGTLTVFTGYANAGKSTVMNAIIANLLRLNIPTCVASFETEVKPILRDYLRASILGCGVNDLRGVDTSHADELMQDNLRIITQLVDEDDEMDLEFFLSLCRATVTRDGTKVIILDPWNELEHKRRPGEEETTYIGRALRAIKKFAKQNDVAFWIIAHPTKPFEGRVRMPKLLDISGSANWANKADFGLSYHRPDPEVNEAQLCVTKVRMGYPGKRGTVKVTYDFRSSQFREVV